MSLRGCDRALVDPPAAAPADLEGEMVASPEVGEGTLLHGMPYLAFGAGPPASAAAGVHDGSCQSGWSAAPVRDLLAGSAGAALSGVRGRPRTRHVVGCVDGRPGPGPRRGNPGRVRHRCGRDGGFIGRLGGGGSGPAGGSVPRAGEGRAPLGARLLAPLMWLLDPLLRPGTPPTWWPLPTPRTRSILARGWARSPLRHWWSRAPGQHLLTGDPAADGAGNTGGSADPLSTHRACRHPHPPPVRHRPSGLPPGCRLGFACLG